MSDICLDLFVSEDKLGVIEPAHDVVHAPRYPMSKGRVKYQTEKKNQYTFSLLAVGNAIRQVRERPTTSQAKSLRDLERNRRDPGACLVTHRQEVCPFSQQRPYHPTTHYFFWAGGRPYKAFRAATLSASVEYGEMRTCSKECRALE